MDNTGANDGMKYVGPDRLIGVPARDLSEAEVTQYGRAMLLASGLYTAHKVKKVYASKPIKSALKGGPPAEE